MKLEHEIKLTAGEADELLRFSPMLSCRSTAWGAGRLRGRIPGTPGSMSISVRAALPVGCPMRAVFLPARFAGCTPRTSLRKHGPSGRGLPGLSPSRIPETTHLRATDLLPPAWCWSSSSTTARVLRSSSLTAAQGGAAAVSSELVTVAGRRAVYRSSRPQRGSRT